MVGDELQFVEWLRGQCRKSAAVKLGVGDDMAVLKMPAGQTLVASDMLLDGVHFDTRRHTLQQIGRKAVACSLSDCAAMAVEPVAATVSVSLPAKTTFSDAKELYNGVLGIADEYGLAIVGGDTTSWKHPLAIDVAVVATPYEGIEPVTRSGARAGDGLFVTGHLGGSLLGRHLTFTPRVREARVLAETLGRRLHAMLDISDGLALDLWRMCQSSCVGAALDEQLLERVISEDARRAATADGIAALDHALADGEDFELLLAVGGEIAHPPVTLYPIGRITEANLVVRRTDGKVEPLEPRGYVH